MDNWAYVFEKNTIGTSISISLTKLESWIFKCYC